MERIINCKIEGIAPLLQHKLSLAVEAGLDSKTKKRAGQAKEDNPEEFLYVDKEGNIVQPSEHILQAVIKKMSNYKIQGRGKKTYKELAQGCINICPEFIKHEFPEWDADVRTVVIPATKGRTVRKRPKFDKWALNFAIHLFNDEMPIEVLKGALDDAGRESGIGDYRPRFGRFMVTQFEVL